MYPVLLTMCHEGQFLWLLWCCCSGLHCTEPYIHHIHKDLLQTKCIRLHYIICTKQTCNSVYLMLIIWLYQALINGQKDILTVRQIIESFSTQKIKLMHTSS